MFWPHPSLVKQEFNRFSVGVGVRCFGLAKPW